MTGDRSRRELTVLLLAGAAGAGLVLLASRQELARITVIAPAPLPATVTTVTAQRLIPAASALAVAALASLAAVLATRGWLRRVTGLMTSGLGAGIAALALGRITRAGVLAAASRVSPATGTGAGAAAGSVTSGGSGGGGGLLSGFPAHVLITGAGWRYLMVAGAMVVVVSGALIVFRAMRLPALSARYDRPERDERTHRDKRTQGPGPARSAPAVRSASMWESLSAGWDPTQD